MPGFYTQNGENLPDFSVVDPSVILEFIGFSSKQFGTAIV